MIAREMQRLVKAFGYSRDGFAASLREDAPFRLEAILSLVIVPAALWCGETGIERAILLGSWLLVPVVELLNCGIEAAVDYATQGARHPLAKKAKDTGSAAVLLAIVIFLACWGMVLAG